MFTWVCIISGPNFNAPPRPVESMSACMGSGAEVGVGAGGLCVYQAPQAMRPAFEES